MSNRIELLLGDEAVAHAGIYSGISGAFGYPGTPATEIFETIQAHAPDVWAHWSTNEKVAYEEALGMSYAGKRAIVSMKHVGLNVASDPFMSSALTGVNGGLVLAVGDDPGMHSSQNEQDSRFYADFAMIPCFEPSSQQEAFDMTCEAFRLSEELRIPAMVKLVTRLAHSRSTVTIPCEGAASRERELPLPDPNDWALIPVNARRRFRRLIKLQDALQEYANASPFNHLHLRGKRGIVCTSMGYNYVRELLGPEPEDSLLRIGFYPAPKSLICRLLDHCDEILVIEEGYPFLERQIRGIYGIPGTEIRGKIDGPLPRDGELTPERVHLALGGQLETEPPDELLAARPPQLCKGCPHSDTFSALVDAVADYSHPVLFSDIGCYTLGIMAPYRAVHSCVDMGASIGMAHGALRAGAYPVLCTIGDSTFAHSGMTPLLGAVRADADITVLILDNAITGMTGQQETMATGEDLVEILRGLGVKDLHVCEPLKRNHSENVEMIRQAIQHKGLSVVILRRACIQIKPHKLAAVPQAVEASV